MAGGRNDSKDAGGGSSGPSRTITDGFETRDVPSPSETEDATAEWEVGTLIGRYVVLARLGAGAMGVVYAAYDPELDRKVALKLLRGRGDTKLASKARLQREAQALARLNHRNVVTVHDVGTHAGRVFVAMEFLEGRTLREWIKALPVGKGRPWRETRAIFDAAGQGLAAAHAAGLVHRDFKPDNVMLTEDGRVVVMDFGLARAGEDDSDEPRSSGPLTNTELEDVEISSSDALGTPLTRTGAMMGTPAYMAPEQFAGTGVTARSDQFGFCIALHEALYGVRPFGSGSVAQLMVKVTEGAFVEPPPGSEAPPWLRKIVLRGLSPKPDDRFPAITDLLAAIAASEARLRRNRRLLFAGGVLALVAGITGIREFGEASRRAECEAEGEAVDEVWGDSQEVALREAFDQSGVSYARDVAEKVVPWLDERASQWRQQATEACLAVNVHGTWDAPTLDRATWCLDENRLALKSFVTQLQAPDAQIVQRAVQAAAALSPATRCGDVGELENMPDPPSDALRPRVSELREELSRAGHLTRTGKIAEALQLAKQTREAARDVDWAPLTAKVLAFEAGLLARSGAPKEAKEAGVDAFVVASGARAWGAAAQAATDLTHLVGVTQADREEGLTWSRLAEMAIGHAGDPTGLKHARLDTRLGGVRREAGDYEAAREHYEAALDGFVEALGPDHPRVGAALNNLGNLHGSKGEFDRAHERFDQALVVMEASLGPRHPTLVTMLNNLANVNGAQGDYLEARELSVRALSIIEDTLGRDHPSAATSLANLGAVQYSLGDYAESKKTYRRALEIQEKVSGADHPHVAALLNSLGVAHQLTGEYEDAAKLQQRALDIYVKAFGAEHPSVARATNDVGVALRSLGRLDEAEGLHRRSIDLWKATLGAENPDIAHARTDLGKTLRLLGRLAEAKRELVAGLAMTEKLLGPEHPDVSSALGDLGETQLALGEVADAVASLERALKIREKALGPDNPALDLLLTPLGRARFEHGATSLAIATLERALALPPPKGRREQRPFTRFALAKALWDAPAGEGRDRPRASTLAREAKAAFSSNARSDSVAEVDAWVAEHPGTH